MLFKYKRQEYKRTGGTTTNLQRHLEKKHPGKLNLDNKNTGSMDKFVVNAIPVSFEFSYFFFFFFKDILLI